MTQAEPPKIVKKKLFSPIWLLPIVALILGGWLGVKSLREQGIEIEIHFPSATGIDVGKTLVRYQGLNVGKVVDIGLDSSLTGVDVKVLMDYRAEPFLKKNTKFWLVTPKASITGVEGLDALFSGNYIAVQPGDGDSQSNFVALQEAPAIQPGETGVVVELKAMQLGSVDVGSKVFFSQIPVGDVVSYKLEADQSITISAFIKEQYAYLVKTNSRFWNVSGISVDASLSGVKFHSESLSAILAGGIAFSSDPAAPQAQHNTAFNLYDNKQQALGGRDFLLSAQNADGIGKGTKIQLRGVQIGEILGTSLSDTGVGFNARLFNDYEDLLAGSSQFYLQGADISLDGVKHAARLVTGAVIEFIPGSGPASGTYQLLESQPEDKGEHLTLRAFSESNPGVSVGAAIKYKAFDIGTVTSVSLAKDFSGVEYQLEIPAQFSALLSHGSYLYGQSALEVNASLEGVAVKTSDAGTLLKGSFNLVRGKGRNLMTNNDLLEVFPSREAAEQEFTAASQQKITLTSLDGAGVSSGSPVYYKKMQVGDVADVSWSASEGNFAVNLNIHATFKSLLNDSTVFWQNSAVEVNAGLSGVDVKVAPLAGALKGSISLGQLEDTPVAGTKGILYASEQLAIAQAKVIELTFPADADLAAGAAIRYKGFQIGEVDHVSLSDDLGSIKAIAWLYGQYAAEFQRADTQYYLVNAQVSLAGIKAPETLLTGPYISSLPGNSVSESAHFNGKLQAGLYADTPADALKVTLVRPALGSVKAGTPVLYRGIHIGEVKGYDLNASGQQVQIYLAIETRFSQLINRTSKFWDYSGIKVDFGLFSGAQVETGSVENILAGGIAVATEAANSPDNRLTDSPVFTLHNKADEEWRNWAPALK
ncbi:MlaD family protein [Shewanella corallii]|uniref:MlaD family protein n=1 Tax=Shewanella corallii TaxID=560080 RepID=A0ABT0N8Q3_9GAMM|nr:MlaD family protein [Shewanella corallii]MCL2914197.1 MlaD family protein [Shewanella corallii]